MNSVLEQLGLRGIVPVVVIDEAANAVPLAEALLEGGLSCIEVTFRTAAAPAAIGSIAKKHGDMLLGAGTVLTVDQAKEAVDLGCRFIVSPGLNRSVVEYCLKHEIPVTPGVATPTDVEGAIGLGLDVVKFFPAEASGGLAYLKAIAAPYKKVSFIPTGGVDEKNLLGYLRFPQVLACGGSWMVKADLISSGKFDEIAQLASNAVQLMLGFRLKEIGVYAPDAADAKAAATLLATMLRLPVTEGPSSLVVGGGFEILKGTSDTHGRIGIGTNFIERAVSYLGSQGLKVRQDTRQEKNGKLVGISLEEKVGGFTLHLVQL